MAEIVMDRVPGKPAIALSRCGDGDFVVFLHGIGGNRTNWDSQLAFFGSRFHAVAWDARGYGDSDDYEGPVSFADFTADLLRVLDHCGADTAHIVGLSLGGRIAQRFYAFHPDRVASLSLVDTRPDTQDTRTPAELAEFLRLRAEPLMSGKTPADIAPKVAASLIGPKAGEDIFNTLVASVSRLRTGPYLKTIEANVRDDYAGAPGTIRVPTLVVVGADDSLTTPAVARQLAGEIPRARYMEIPDAGHISNLEQPEAFNRALLDFLDSL